MNQVYRVAIVVDREYGPNLSNLAQRLHVWICESPTNRAAVETIWRSQDGVYDIESGATIFNCAPDTPCETALIDIIGTVDEHHGEHSHDPPWLVIEVIGCAPSTRVRDAFAAFGAEVTELGTDQFEAHRTLNYQAQKADNQLRT